ncbi:mechanosensitive ion channel [Erythrobacter sp. 3-20A1M]|uniref:mechanosensitive ion channel family protein n=1 Tax=Erythrobacter sp. 3-20A1M TaxID=2653850 RepID=UPI001BFC08AA|nr:mechanosensitive ion channel domain-containing protein [Erythrobacter sp. 3-20A1M]QWC57202.1 mechanosensitive ion channel [Erythrobacter sp. 3-20A1M]
MLDGLDPRNWNVSPEQGAIAALALGIAVVVVLALHWLAFSLMRRVVRGTHTQADNLIIERLYKPTRWLGVAIAVGIVARHDRVVAVPWEALARFVVPALLGWLALAVVRGLADAMEQRLDEREDPIAARSRKTKISIFSRVASVVVIIITLALVLIGIPGVRQVGVTLMASAGLAALAIGAAAQPALKSLIAGLQMALTEPIRIGDLVVIDGHTGRVEEIRMSYVLVRTWDERLAVVPTNRFLENTFENWSRSSEKLTAPIFLYLDPIADIDPIREEFLRWVATHELWDQRTAKAVISDARAETVTLRLSVSALTIGDLFQLGWDLREHMLRWLRENQPEALIRRRMEVEHANERADGPTI